MSMRLNFNRPHKSITSFPNIELPNFVVLTGVNGAGKSHLLEAIENGPIQIDDIVVANNPTVPVRRFDWTNLVPQDSGAYPPSQLTTEKHQLWTQFAGIFDIFQQMISQNLGGLDQSSRAKVLGLSSSEIQAVSLDKLVQLGIAPGHVQFVLSQIQQASQNAINIFISQNRHERQRLIDLLNSRISKPIFEINENDFYRSLQGGWQAIDIFQQSFGRLFADYIGVWHSNQLKELAASKGKDVSFFTDTEFEQQYGEPPWDFVNRIFQMASLDFRIKEPEMYEDRVYDPVLIDIVRGTEVRFGSLSSGEKILMSFAFCLYYAKDKRQFMNYPKVLLFDEIDAPLHPSMTQSLLKTIQEVLIEEYGIKVIMTTHSPSTVALAPEESLYAMYKTEGRRIGKTTKDKALSILTSGVPTLSIDYENRRQVFVESQYDVSYYEEIYRHIKKDLIPGISLNFISSGSSPKGDGNCEQVKKFVNELYGAGNKTVYGIIDWDTKNNPNQRVRVLGHRQRYSIENYILDPLLVVALLLREKFIE